MAREFYLTSESVVYRQVLGQLVVIQLNTGKMFYFSEGTESLLKFFKEPKRLDAFFSATDNESNATEMDHLKGLVAFMVENQLLEETSLGTAEVPSKFDYARPEFIRLGLTDATLLEAVSSKATLLTTDDRFRHQRDGLAGYERVADAAGLSRTWGDRWGRRHDCTRRHSYGCDRRTSRHSISRHRRCDGR